MVKNKPVYAFEEADSKKRMLLGGKGAGLSEMTRLKLPVPPGFTITTEVCNKYYENGRKLPKEVMPAVMKNILKMEKKTGKKWNSTKNPLLVSVRSGAAISMPGMMDTILNLGLNEKTVEGFAAQTKNPRFSWDSYRRFIQLFGKVVFGVNDEKFDHVLDSAKSKQGVTDDSKLNVESLKKIVREYKKICENHTKRKFPDTPNEQLGLAIEAVFKSWMGERAVVYREKNGITKDIANGTAVNVVTMVFGNMGDDSATGVVFTRNGHNGKREIEGEYLTNAQGEDVVAGVRTGKNVELLKKEMPKSHKELSNACEKLEKHFREPQDIEFTIEQGKFYLLQTRTAKMSAGALVKTSVDMVKEKLIDKNRSLTRIPAQQLEALLHRTMDESKIKDHKFMGSLTAGILAGKKKYVKNIYLQNLGIGRGMKVGKEAIFAAIIGVENWYKRDLKKEINNQNKILKFWIKFFEKEKFNGISYEIVADPTGNKINRLRIYVKHKRAKYTIQSLSYYLEKNNPAIFVRDDLIHLGHFELDTCNLKKGQEKIVAKEIKKIITKLSSNKIKNNITQKEYATKSSKEWLSWLN